MTVLSSSVLGSIDDVSLVRICKESVKASDDESSDAASKWLHEGAQLLNFQWPKGGSVEAYKEKIINEASLSSRIQPDDSSNTFYALPSSYLLIHQNECIG